MGGGVLVGGIPGMPAMVQQMPGAAVQQLGGQLGGQLGLIGMPRFRWPDLPSSESTAVNNLQLQLARAAAGQPGGGALAGQATTNLLAHPLLGASAAAATAGQPGQPAGPAGVFLLPRLP